MGTCMSVVLTITVETAGNSDPLSDIRMVMEIESASRKTKSLDTSRRISALYAGLKFPAWRIAPCKLYRFRNEIMRQCVLSI